MNEEERLDAFFLSFYTLCTWGFVNLHTLKICFWSFIDANYTKGKKSYFMLYVCSRKTISLHQENIITTPFFFFSNSCPPGTWHHKHSLRFYFCHRVRGTHFLSKNSPTFSWQETILLIVTSPHSSWFRIAEIKYMFSPYLIIICYFTATIASFLAHTSKSTGARLVPLNWTSSYVLAAQLN